MKLITPVGIGKLEAPSRVVSTAHAAYLDFFQPGNSGERYMAYQERRARGGAGMIILTAMHVHESSGLLNHFNYEESDIARKFQQLSTRVHRYGTVAIAQLFHYGAQSISSVRPDMHPLWGWSATLNSEGETAHAMSDAEVESVIDGFARTAAIAVENGMDGVELHGTHGYLIQQSFSPMFNRRQDKWGEPLAFITELAKRVRAAIGPDKIMGFRTTADDLVGEAKGGVSVEMLRDYTARIIASGNFDYLNHSEGQGGAYYASAIGSFRRQFGEWLPLTKGLREAIDGAVPVIGVGKIPTPDLAERALEEGICDMVGMTRAQIADPDLVSKLREGKGDRIRTCTGANQGCIDRARYPITCIQNPEVGEENRFRDLAKLPVTPKRVLVVGGGPGGMKAAEIAARRGHEVTLVESSSRLGGRLNLVETLGAASNLLSATSWIERELEDLPVDIRYQCTVDEDFVRSISPNAIILATGAEPRITIECEDDDSVPIIPSDDAVIGEFDGYKFEMQDTHALLYDPRGNYETALVIEALVDRGAKVTLVTPLPAWGANLGFTHMVDLSSRLAKAGTRFITGARIGAIKGGLVTVRTALTGADEDIGADYIVDAGPARARDELRAMCEAMAPTHLVGDAIAPRSALEAIREGDRVGRTI